MHMASLWAHIPHTREGENIFLPLSQKSAHILVFAEGNKV